MKEIKKFHYISVVSLVLLVAPIAWGVIGQTSTEKATDAYHALTPEEQDTVDKFYRNLPEDNTPYSLLGLMFFGGIGGLGVLAWKSWRAKNKVLIHKDKLEHLKEQVETSENFTCEICGDKFDSKRGLRIHKSRTHKE